MNWNDVNDFIPVYGWPVLAYEDGKYILCSMHHDGFFYRLYGKKQVWPSHWQYFNQNIIQ